MFYVQVWVCAVSRGPGNSLFIDMFYTQVWVDAISRGLNNSLFIDMFYTQVWVGAISRGPGNSQLLGTYEHAETFAYQDEIGQVLLTICKVTYHQQFNYPT